MRPRLLTLPCHISKPTKLIWTKFSARIVKVLLNPHCRFHCDLPRIKAWRIYLAKYSISEDHRSECFHSYMQSLKTSATLCVCVFVCVCVCTCVRACTHSCMQCMWHSTCWKMLTWKLSTRHCLSCSAGVWHIETTQNTSAFVTD